SVARDRSAGRHDEEREHLLGTLEHAAEAKAGGVGDERISDAGGGPGAERAHRPRAARGIDATHAGEPNDRAAREGRRARVAAGAPEAGAEGREDFALVEGRDLALRELTLRRPCARDVVGYRRARGGPPRRRLCRERIRRANAVNLDQRLFAMSRSNDLRDEAERRLRGACHARRRNEIGDDRVARPCEGTEAAELAIEYAEVALGDAVRALGDDPRQGRKDERKGSYVGVEERIVPRDCKGTSLASRRRGRDDGGGGHRERRSRFGRGDGRRHGPRRERPLLERDWFHMPACLIEPLEEALAVGEELEVH